MERTKSYRRAKFTAETIRLAVERMTEGIEPTTLPQRSRLEVDVDGAWWTHDTEEEFFADYRRCEGSAKFGKRFENRELKVDLDRHNTEVLVMAESRALIMSVFEVFEAHAQASTRPAPPESPEPKPRVFIGHGRSMQWRDLKDHLHDKHGYDVEAYEVGARAGHAVRDVLEDMMENSAFALLVMTGEDETTTGLRARQNVVHEAGLFQGRLGFKRAIILLEDGTEAFSNIEGIDQIRYSKENIREAFGDVLATLKREFQ